MTCSYLKWLPFLGYAGKMHFLKFEVAGIVSVNFWKQPFTIN